MQTLTVKNVNPALLFVSHVQINLSIVLLVYLDLHYILTLLQIHAFLAVVLKDMQILLSKNVKIVIVHAQAVLDL